MNNIEVGDIVRMKDGDGLFHILAINKRAAVMKILYAPSNGVTVADGDVKEYSIGFINDKMLKYKKQ